MNSLPLVHVVGHQCPDTDAVVSAVMAARLLERTRPGFRYEPLMQGVATPQTAWLFERAGEPLPRIRADVRPTAGECCVQARSLDPSSPVGLALDLMHEEGYSLLPVVQEEGRLMGAISQVLPEARYLTHFNLEDFLGTLVTPNELVRGLGLLPLNEPARRVEVGLDTVPVAPGGVFRLHGGVPARAGDLLLAGPCPEAVAAAAACGACLLVLADCDASEAGRWSVDAALPVFLFPGSLMALVTQLPRAIPVGRIMSTGIPVARADDLLEDLRGLFVRTPHALPVVDADDRLIGMISRREALQPPRRGLVLVDHFERGQAVRGWDRAEIVQIIDHHRVGGLETVEPARVDCRPLGSTASIIALRFEEAGLEPGAAEAGLLLGAIVADTLLLTSPTTTDADRGLAERLAAIAGVDLASFGREVLARNDGLASDSAASLVARDLKEFARGETRFLLGQIETVDLGLLDAARAASLRAELDAARGRAGAAFALTMVTDVLSGMSRILAADPDRRRVRHLLEGDEPALGVERAMVSRKKQLVPWVMGRLATFSP